MSDYEPPDWFRECRAKNPENCEYFSQCGSKIHTAFNEYTRFGRFPYCAAPAARLGWGKRAFPGHDDPLERLWAEIFHFASADQSNYAAVLKEKRLAQQRRFEKLNALRIRELHITGGGNDLFLGITEKARWVSGSVKTKTAQPYWPNFPSHEVFTVPDCVKTEGTLVTSMPFRLFSLSMVRDLVLEFRAGKVVGFEAGEGKEAFGRWIDTDGGARLLGEIGLVGDDSPIYDAGVYFDFPNFDENTASHVALGDGLGFTLSGAGQMSETELALSGCNKSIIHTDMMFGSPEVSIIATKSANGAVPLLEGGRWGEGL